MKIFLVRHGKSDKSLEGTLSHEEFELKRPLVAGEEEKARQLGALLKGQVGEISDYDLVFSGKVRSQQTVLAIGEGFGLSPDEALAHLREDSGLTYLAEKKYWQDAEDTIKNGVYTSHADFFLNTPPYHPEQTFRAADMQQQIKAALRTAIERNISHANAVCIMVSHEPVISLCMSDLTGKSVTDLGGACKELEYAVFTVNVDANATVPNVELRYRENSYNVNSSLFPS